MTVIHIVGQMRLSMHKILCSLSGTWLWKRLRAHIQTLLLADNKLNFNLRPCSLVPHLSAQIVIYIVAPRDFSNLRTWSTHSHSAFFYLFIFILHLLIFHTHTVPAWAAFTISLSSSAHLISACQFLTNSLFLPRKVTIKKSKENR